MFTTRNIVIAAALVIGLIVMKVTGLGLGDLWQMAQGEFDRKRSQAHEYQTGQFTAPLTKQLNSEAAKITASQANTGSGIDGELRRELNDERKRQLEENARNAEKIGTQVLRGDVEVIKRTARENAAKSAAQY